MVLGVHPTNSPQRSPLKAVSSLLKFDKKKHKNMPVIGPLYYTAVNF